MTPEHARRGDYESDGGDENLCDGQSSPESDGPVTCEACLRLIVACSKTAGVAS